MTKSCPWRRARALTLALTLTAAGLPPVVAADDPAPATPSKRTLLTCNGLPISLLVSLTDRPVSVLRIQAAGTGQISGVAKDLDANPLAAHTVRLSRTFATGPQDLPTQEMIGTSTTDADGRFSFDGLQPSNYFLELLNGDEILGSATLALREGVMRASEIIVVSGISEASFGLSRSLETVPAIEDTGDDGFSTLAWIAIGALAVGVLAPGFLAR